MKYHVNIYNEIARKYTIKEILSDNWYDFLDEMEKQGKPVRETILHEVEKVLGCQDPYKGFRLYSCPKCHHTKRVPFTCKSRFCNTCGGKYSKDRALNMSKKLINCNHRHVVFTIPQQLRKFFALDRKLLNLLFKAAANTIYFAFNKRNKSENYIPGMITVLHTFGRDLKWNPHIHMILCEEAIGNSNIWRRFNHINYEGLRRSWQFSILKLMQQKITSPAFKALVDKLYDDYKSGFYVNSPPVKNFNNGVVNYILRYAGRPAIAQSRITHYDDEFVTFQYTPHDSDTIISEKIPVFEFIKRLIIHIPEKHFKMIRYFGFYWLHNPKFNMYLLRARKIHPDIIALRRNSISTWRNRIKTSFLTDPLICTFCRATMELIDILQDPREIAYYFSCIARDTS
jgi:hypothetical protein